MSLFSDINGFNSKTIKNYYDTKGDKTTDFSEVDFCVDNENELFTSNTEVNNQTNNTKDIQAKIEEYMYNYDMTAQEAEDYLNRNMNIEG